jgi:hypothetical protein
MLLGAATYDATIAAWIQNMLTKRLRPYEADKRRKAYAIKPESPSYPCEHSVAAGVAVAMFSKFIRLGDSVNRLAHKINELKSMQLVLHFQVSKAGFDY